ALFQRRIDIAACDLLRHAADLGDDGARETADAEFQASEIIHRLDLFPEPAAHLGACASGRNADALVFFQEVVEQFGAATELQPARRKPPLYFRIRLRNRRCRNRARGETDAADFQEITTFHFASPLCFCDADQRTTI